VNQPSLFDDPTPFERGMAASAKAARKWTDEQIAQVDRAIKRVAYFRLHWTVDQVWEQLPDGFPVNKGIGARLNKAARAGMIRATDRTRISRRTNEHGHGQRLTVWETVERPADAL
tara:strand:+ start:621 stop:968 length:348 start_codon:yes stop_codon:yes gene_type:complete